MPAHITITFDTTAPANPALLLAGGASVVGSRNTAVAFASDDTDKTGYQVKLWGDLDGGPATEGAAAWQAWSASVLVTLSAGDGPKVVYGKVRDDVGNETGVLSDSTTLDTTVPVVAVGAPSQPKISKVVGFDTATATFQSDSPFEEYEVRVVPTSGSARTEGAVIPTTAGSINTSGNAGSYPAATNIQITIKGADLEAAAPGDGTKVIKVFVRDTAGNWST